MSIETAKEVVWYGLGGSAGLTAFVVSLKYFLKDVLPILKNISSPADGSKAHDKCAYHDSMSEIVKNVNESHDLLISVKATLDNFVNTYNKTNEILADLIKKQQETEKSIIKIEQKVETLEKEIAKS